MECLPGAEIKSEASEQSLLLTVVAKGGGDGNTSSNTSSSRLVAMKLSSRDQRNSIVTGLRTLVADLHINSPSAKALKTITTSFSTSTSAAAVVPSSVNPMMFSRQSSSNNNNPMRKGSIDPSDEKFNLKETVSLLYLSYQHLFIFRAFHRRLTPSCITSCRTRRATESES